MKNERVNCPECGKEYSKVGLRTHTWRAHSDEGKKFNPNIGYTKGSRVAWNKGLTKETDQRVRSLAKTLSKGYKSGKNIPANKGKKLSNEAKMKISISRKKFLKENPDKVPYKLNHKHKETYPEKYFGKILRGFISQYLIPGTLYCGDFVNPDNKLIIEIDGEQHYVDAKMVKHDEKRYKKLTQLGWNVIRIRWREYCKLNMEERKEVVHDLLEHSIDPTQKITKYSEYKEGLEKEVKDKRIRERKEYLENRKKLILESGIDFGKFGWVKEVSKLFNISNNKGGNFIRKYMPEFYEERCFKRKK